MPYNEALATRVRAALAGRSDVEEKKMFGGVSWMVGGQMCCGVLKDDLVVKLAPSEGERLVTQPHVRPFDFSGRPMTGMVYVAHAALADDAALEEWLQRGLSYVAAHPKTSRPKRKK